MSQVGLYLLFLLKQIKQCNITTTFKINEKIAAFPDSSGAPDLNCTSLVVLKNNGPKIVYI